jgi:hypothetical protein
MSFSTTETTTTSTRDTRVLRAVPLETHQADDADISKSNSTHTVYYLPVIDCSSSMSDAFDGLRTSLVRDLLRPLEAQTNVEVLDAICFNHDVFPNVGSTHGLLSMTVGGKTDIVKATDAVQNKLIDVLSHISDQSSMTIRILLVSDGDDTCHGTPHNFRQHYKYQTSRIRKILQSNSAYNECASVEVTTIAVGEKFPTQSALDFQNAFATHKDTDTYIPPVFSIFTSPFSSMFHTNVSEVMSEIASYWDQPLRTRYNIPMNVRMNWHPHHYPWEYNSDHGEEEMTSVTEGGLVLVVNPWPDTDNNRLHDRIRIACQGQEVSQNDHASAFELREPRYLTKKDLAGLLLGWCHALQKRVACTRDEEPTERLQRDAASAIFAFEHIRHVYKPPKTGKPKRYARDRLQQYRQLNETDSESDDQIEKALTELRNIRDDVDYRRLDDREMQRRLEIGTRTGKFHRRMEKQWGVDQSKFEAMKEEFLSLLETHTVHSEDTIRQQHKKETQAPSDVSLQSLRDVLTDETLPEALRDCRDAYELVQMFPVVGYAVSLRRTNASRIDPWLVQVQHRGKGVIRHLDTHTFLCFCGADEFYTDKEAHYKDPQTGETFNAVVPLLKDGDTDLVPFVLSRLFQLLMTYNVCQTVDAMLPQATLGLLGAFFQYVLADACSESSTDSCSHTLSLLDDIRDTAYMLTLTDTAIEQNVSTSTTEDNCDDNNSESGSVDTWNYWHALESYIQQSIIGWNPDDDYKPLYQYFISDAPSIPFTCHSLAKPLLGLTMAVETGHSDGLCAFADSKDPDMLSERDLKEFVMYWVAQFVYRAWKKTDFTDVKNVLWSYLRDRWTFLSSESDVSVGDSKALESSLKVQVMDLYRTWISRVDQLTFDNFPAHEDELLRDVETNAKNELKQHMDSTVLPELWWQVTHRMQERYHAAPEDIADAVRRSLPRVHGMSLDTIKHWLHIYASSNYEITPSLVNNYALHATMLYVDNSGSSNLEFMQRVATWLDPTTGCLFAPTAEERSSSDSTSTIFWNLSKRLVGDVQKESLNRILEDILTRADTAYMDYMRRTHDEPNPTYYFEWDEYIEALKFDHPQATLSRADIQENAADQRYLFKLPRPTGLQPFACQQPDCPLYMVPRHNLDAHLGFDK